MIQFKYDQVMKRYNVLAPFTLKGEPSNALEGKYKVTVASISEDNRLTMHRELRIDLVRQILMHWDEYEHQITRELDELLDEDKNEKLTYLVERLQLSSWKDIPIESCPESDYLDFSVRTWNCLWSVGIQTVGELVEKSAGDIRRIKNCGRRSLTEIEERLSEVGLTLK